MCELRRLSFAQSLPEGVCEVAPGLTGWLLRCCAHQHTPRSHRRSPRRSLRSLLSAVPSSTRCGITSPRLVEEYGVGRKHLRLRDITSIPLDEGGCVLLGEHCRDEIASGSSASSGDRSSSSRRFPQNAFAPSQNRDTRTRSTHCLCARCMTVEHCSRARTATTDEHARRWLRRSWTFGVGSGAHVLVNGCSM